ncbi:MAG: hypothetical protein H6632_15430 [Anaerolineales bacterium]|nr:hypothetical protein [Anaerolineales bacterium]
MATSPTTPSTTREENADSEARRKAIELTLASMANVISPAQLTYFSNRSIAEVEALQEEVSAVVPAGNIVGLVMSGLVRLRDRTLPRDRAKSDVSALMRGLDMLPRHILPRTIYGTLFVGPAAVLSAYQKLLMLTGKDPDSAFPEGLWQFYLEFALREDSAHHTNETLGFQQALKNYNLNLSEIDQLAAWVCTVSHAYFQFDDWLFNEWRERVLLYLIDEAVAEANLGHKISFKRISQAWATQRPYRRGQDAQPDENFAQYRQRRFDNFFESRFTLLPEAQQERLQGIYHQRVLTELPAYQQQLSILATLEPDKYRENKRVVPLWQARVGIILKNRYYLIPAYLSDQIGRPVLFESELPDSKFYPLQLDYNGSLYDLEGHALDVSRSGQIFQKNTKQLIGYLRPASFQAIRRQIAAIFEHAASVEIVAAGGLDDQLISIRRVEQEQARKVLPNDLARQEIQAIKCAPVLINWDEQARNQPLAHIRQHKRGIGDHALTIFKTPESVVFDQSHIFFDGLWGMAVSEILTGEAISWAGYFNTLSQPKPVSEPPYYLNFKPELALNEFNKVAVVEVSAENNTINMKTLHMLRDLLPKRHPDLKLTVNDILVLYRCAFGLDYRPAPALEDKLFELSIQNRAETQDAHQLIHAALAKAQQNNPSIVIPMDAMSARPQERLYPTTFRNPFTELWGHYQEASDTLEQYHRHKTQKQWADFSAARRSLLAQLNYFGQIMRAYKRVALEGGSTSTAIMKLLAHLPNSLLRLLDEIPQRVDILNEVLKGEEVFSNGGRVARGSSISRFISAKDDSYNKALVWGVLTDDQDMMHLSLRDFRPHVAALRAINSADLAELIVQDYLDAFASGFNQFIQRLLDILNANATHSVEEVAA